MKPTKTQKLFFCTLALIIIVNLSCKKTSSSTQILTADATIIDQGGVAADGCGWLVKINATDSIYNAPNLAAKYQVDGLKLQITYQKLSERFYCGMTPVPQNPGITEIKINTIKAGN